jgi:predicted lactoylglutathione lyase
MSKMIFINLPVKDLAAATHFYEAIGCAKNAAFSDEKASSMAWSDAITFQLLTHDFYATFTRQPIADANVTCMAAPSSIQTAMCSNRCGWICRPCRRAEAER